MKSSKSLITILAIAGVIVILYVLKPTSENAASPNKGKSNKNGPVSVNAYVAKATTLDNTLFITGNTVANEEAEIKSEISGRIVKIYFREGSRVNKGDLLVKIYDNDLQAQLKKLNYRLELAALNESRQKKLLEVNGISQQEYDQSLNDLKQVQADIDVMKTAIEKTEIVAPFTGIIGLRNVSEGSYLSPSVTISTIVQSDPIKIEFSVPERYTSQLSPNSKITFNTEGSSVDYSGTVYATGPAIEEASGTLRVRATAPNPNGKILPGSFAHIVLRLNEYENSILVPTQAIIPQLKGNKVFLSRGGKAFPQDVAIGIRNDTSVQVLSGVQPGDTVLITGIFAVKPGTPLKIINSK